MFHLLLIASGGAAGAALRHLSNQAALRLFGPGFPWGTMFVNIAGSLAMGLFIGWMVKRAGGSSNELRLLVATGFLGGFTTFSAFSLDFATLWREGAMASAFTYAIASVVLSIGAVFAGLWVMRGAS